MTRDLLLSHIQSWLKMTITRKLLHHANHSPQWLMDQKSSPQPRSRCQYTQQHFPAIYFAFKDFGHIFWGARKLVIIFTDNKAVTRFFQTTIVPPALCNACDDVIQFNFVIPHIPGAQNTAAHYLSHLEADPKDWSEIGHEDPWICTNSTNWNQRSINVEDETEELYWTRKKATRRNPATAEPALTIQSVST